LRKFFRREEYGLSCAAAAEKLATIRVDDVRPLNRRMLEMALRLFDRPAIRGESARASQPSMKPIRQIAHPS
ncbi:MAG TPA: hypothetical protein VH482_33750, partial [Thermomicrobiales bacterium]